MTRYFHTSIGCQQGRQRARGKGAGFRRSFQDGVLTVRSHLRQEDEKDWVGPCCLFKTITQDAHYFQPGGASSR